MKVLTPSRTYSSPSRRAVVAIAPTSEPASGSVIANAAIARPATTSGNHRVALRGAAGESERHDAERLQREDRVSERRGAGERFADEAEGTQVAAPVGVEPAARLPSPAPAARFGASRRVVRRRAATQDLRRDDLASRRASR